MPLLPQGEREDVSQRGISPGQDEQNIGRGKDKALQDARYVRGPGRLLSLRRKEKRHTSLFRGKIQEENDSSRTD